MPIFEPQDPNFAAVVAASFAKQGLMRALAIELVEVSPGACVRGARGRPRGRPGDPSGEDPPIRGGGRLDNLINPPLAKS
jgi:hypothetical protein